MSNQNKKRLEFVAAVISLILGIIISKVIELYKSRQKKKFDKQDVYAFVLIAAFIVGMYGIWTIFPKLAFYPDRQPLKVQWAMPFGEVESALPDEKPVKMTKVSVVFQQGFTFKYWEGYLYQYSWGKYFFNEDGPDIECKQLLKCSFVRP